MKKKITALLVCLLMIATIPLVAGVTEDIESSPNPDIVGRVWLRGLMFRHIKTGHINNAIAILLHYIEFTPTERTKGIVVLKRVEFSDFLYIGRMYETPLGILVYVFGFFRGGLEVY